MGSMECGRKSYARRTRIVERPTEKENHGEKHG